MKKGRKVWFDYYKKAEILEITLRDSTRAKIESWQINVADKKRARQIMKTIKQKYDIDFGFDLKDEKDLKWIP